MTDTPKTRAPFPLWATLFTLIGIAILCSLGTWQLYRLEWKNNLQNSLQASLNKDLTESLLTPADLDPQALFQRGLLNGVYLFDKQIRLKPRVHEGQVGSHLITPLALSDGSVLLVNRGWIPQNREAVRKGQEQVQAGGLLYHPDPPNAFTPENRPQAGEWFWLDTVAIEQHTDLVKIRSRVMALEQDTLKAGPDMPVKSAAQPHLRNNHLYYAVFWFTMAGVLALIYVIRFGRCR